MHKLDSARHMNVFVCGTSGPGRLLKNSPEDLNTVAMDEHMRDMKKKINLS